VKLLDCYIHSNSKARDITAAKDDIEPSILPRRDFSAKNIEKLSTVYQNTRFAQDNQGKKHLTWMAVAPVQHFYCFVVSA
jgi:hypothetical protein